MQYASDQQDPYMDDDDPYAQQGDDRGQNRYQRDQNGSAPSATMSPQRYPGSKVYSGPAQIICLVALVLANTTTEAARYSLNFLIYPDFAPQLKISGTQYGILSGLGFTVVFVLCLIPWGRASDDYRVGRKAVIAAGLIIQLIFSALQSLCWDFWSLLIVRFGLAVGQAAIAAPSFAVIAHVFNPGFVATANGIFACGIYLGTGLASIAGILAYLYGWQTTFAMYGAFCGFAGLVVVAAVPDEGPGLDDGSRRWWKAEGGALAMWISRPAAALLLGAGCLRFFAGFLSFAFLPIYFQRYVSEGPEGATMAGLWYGLLAAAGGCIGVVVAGVVSDMLVQRGLGGGPAFVAAVGSLQSVIIVFLIAYVPWHNAFNFVCLFVWFLAAEVWLGPATAAVLQRMLPASQRGTGLSAFIAVCSLFGATSPLVCGMLLDRGLLLRDVLAWMVGVASLLAALLLAAVGFLLRDEDFLYDDIDDPPTPPARGSADFSRPGRENTRPGPAYAKPGPDHTRPSNDFHVPPEPAQLGYRPAAPHPAQAPQHRPAAQRRDLSPDRVLV